VCALGGRLVEHPFSIEASSGIITLVGSLDKSRVSYTLNVTATDNGRCCGGTTSKASRGVVVFDVKDINNNAPRFADCSSYSPTVLEKENVGTFVIQVQPTHFTYFSSQISRISVETVAITTEGSENGALSLSRMNISGHVGHAAAFI